MQAWSLIRPEPLYRREAFDAGLRAVGYELTIGAPRFPVKHRDVLVIWNRYHANELLADRFEKEGGTVIIAENGYVRGRHDGGDYYALSVHGHNGSGRWNVGGPERWDSLGVELQSWRESGEHVLIAPNRPFGMRGTVMPSNWVAEVTERVRRVTHRPIRVRPHPANAAPLTPLEDDLRGCHCVVIWSSSVGVHALIAGYRVLCESPYWICKGASASTWDELHAIDDWDARRLAAMRRLAWAQWSVGEIGSGEAFRSLLR